MTGDFQCVLAFCDHPFSFQPFFPLEFIEPPEALEDQKMNFKTIETIYCIGLLGFRMISCPNWE